MYKILKNEAISSNSYLLEIECPLAIKNAMPGQFVIVMGKSDSERIPLTIYDCNKEKGNLFYYPGSYYSWMAISVDKNIKNNFNALMKLSIDWFNKNKEQIYYEIQYIRNTKNGKKGEIKEKGYKIENICYKILNKKGDGYY